MASGAPTLKAKISRQQPLEPYNAERPLERWTLPCQRAAKRPRLLALRSPLREQLQVRSSPDQLQPKADRATAFAPATIANLGPGFDWLGCAVEVSSVFKSNH